MIIAEARFQQVATTMIASISHQGVRKSPVATGIFGLTMRHFVFAKVTRNLFSQTDDPQFILNTAKILMKGSAPNFSGHSMNSPEISIGDPFLRDYRSRNFKIIRVKNEKFPSEKNNLKPYV